MTNLEHPYLTDQLIPYIGNKRKLLPLIWEAIERVITVISTIRTIDYAESR